MSLVTGLDTLFETLEHHDNSSSPGVIAQGLKDLVGLLREDVKGRDEVPDPEPGDAPSVTDIAAGNLAPKAGTRK
jgi:hypothetical protein